MSNMDSVFADCTKDELDFDIMFDSEDSLIDIVAGLNENGEFYTGDTCVFTENDSEGPLEDDDLAEREGKVSSSAIDTENSDVLVGESEDVNPEDEEDEVKDECDAMKNESVYFDRLLESLLESDDPIIDMDDADAREGKDTGVHDTEGVSQEVIDKETKGDASGDHFDHIDDADARDGKTDKDGATEGISTKVVGAAMESIDYDALIESLISEKVIDEDDEEVCPDCGKKVCECGKSVKECGDDCCCDTAARLGKCDGVHDTEGVSQNVLGDGYENNSDEESIIDMDDEDSREGKDTGMDNIEGVDSTPLGAAMESIDYDALIESLISESEDPITDMDDADARDGKDTGVDNTEGVSQEVIDNETKGDASGDHFDHIDDADARNGKTDKDGAVEGVNTKVVGAAMESIDYDALIESLISDNGMEETLDDSNNTDDDLLKDVKCMEEAFELVFEDASEEEDLASADEDDLIDMVVDDEDKGISLSSSYDDDELIDLVINGD